MQSQFTLRSLRHTIECVLATALCGYSVLTTFLKNSISHSEHFLTPSGNPAALITAVAARRADHVRTESYEAPSSSSAALDLLIHALQVSATTEITAQDAPRTMSGRNHTRR